jgi:hypothetical protein
MTRFHSEFYADLHEEGSVLRMNESWLPPVPAQSTRESPSWYAMDGNLFNVDCMPESHKLLEMKSGQAQADDEQRWPE